MQVAVVAGMTQDGVQGTGGVMDMNFVTYVKSADREKDFWLQRDKIFHDLLTEHKMLYFQPNCYISESLF